MSRPDDYQTSRLIRTAGRRRRGGPERVFVASDWRTYSAATPTTVPAAQATMLIAQSYVNGNYDDSVTGKKIVVAFDDGIDLANWATAVSPLLIFRQTSTTYGVPYGLANGEGISDLTVVTKCTGIIDAFDISTLTWNGLAGLPLQSYGSVNTIFAHGYEINVNYHGGLAGPGQFVYSPSHDAIKLYGVLIEAKAACYGYTTLTSIYGGTKHGVRVYDGAPYAPDIPRLVLLSTSET